MSIIQESEKLSILILDDDDSIRSILKKLLIQNYDIKEAESISEFNKLIDTFTPHIILLDLNLPDGDGLNLCKELRKNEKLSDLAILLITGDSDIATIEKGYSLGADDFIRKPIIPYEMKAKVQIIEKIIRTKSKLFNNNQMQKQQIEKLYKFSRFIKNNLKSRDIDSSVSLSKALQEIVFSDYMELVKNIKGLFRTIAKKGNEDIAIPFLQIKKKLDIKVSPTKRIHYFNIKKSDIMIYCALVALVINKELYGYMLFEKTTPFKNEDKEILSLYLDFSSLIYERNKIEQIIVEKNHQYRSEINKIRKIQVGMMPHFNTIHHFEIASSYLPAQELSGDFIDGFNIDENTYQIVLCDVSGHGIASSYVGNELRTLFRIFSQPDKSLSDIVGIVNNTAAQSLKGLYYFCTCIVCQIDLMNDNITYVNAGHPPAILYKSDSQKSIKISQTGSLVGIFEGQVFEEMKIELDKGDCLFLYTDGINEARNVSDPDNEEQFGIERLTSIIEENNEFSTTDILHFVISSVYEFTDFSDQQDDMTAICIKKR